MSETRSSGDDFGFDVFVSVCIAIVLLGLFAVFSTCATVADLKKAVCAEAYARVASASDSLRVSRADGCDLPKPEANR
jgi:hypothetical protein